MTKAQALRATGHMQLQMRAMMTYTDGPADKVVHTLERIHKSILHRTPGDGNIERCLHSLAKVLSVFYMHSMAWLL